jgi:hypothetical protein
VSERPTPETDNNDYAYAFLEQYGYESSLQVAPVDWAEFARRLERERDEARKEIESIKKLLLDPHAVYINMLHGKIAKLDWDKLEHIHGNHPAREQYRLSSVCRELKEENERLKRLVTWPHDADPFTSPDHDNDQNIYQ